MSHKVRNIFNDNCSIVRNKDQLTLYPKNHMEGITLSDERVTILFNVYSQLLVYEQEEMIKKASEKE